MGVKPITSLLEGSVVRMQEEQGDAGLQTPKPTFPSDNSLHFLMVTQPVQLNKPRGLTH